MRNISNARTVNLKGRMKLREVTELINKSIMVVRVTRTEEYDKIVSYKKVKKSKVPIDLLSRIACGRDI